MPSERAKQPLCEELAFVLGEQRVSQRELARRLGVNQAHLSRVLAGQKTPTNPLIEAIAEALSLPEDYFIETRVQRISEALMADPALREEIYTRIKRPNRRRSAGR